MTRARSQESRQARRAAARRAAARRLAAQRIAADRRATQQRRLRRWRLAVLYARMKWTKIDIAFHDAYALIAGPDAAGLIDDMRCQHVVDCIRKM
jgi:hypothetical protein